MRILMLDNEFPPKGGGMGTVNKALLEQFAKNPDIEIDLITSSIHNQRTERQFSERIRIYEVPVGVGNIHHASNVELVQYAFEAFRLGDRLAKRGRYDFSFAWSAVPAGAVSLMLERRRGLPFMTWVSGPDIPGFERRYDGLFPLLKSLLLRVWRRSQPLIAKCREEVDLIHAVAPDVLVEVIPNGVDTARFKPGRPIAENGRLNVVCAARLIERKGQRQLIAAVQMLRDRGADVGVRLVGDGDALEAYRQEAEARGVSDRVEFAGFVEPDRIPGYLAEADVFALPSRFEGMSLATLEAMATGLPLVVTPTGGIRELVEEGVNGFTFAWGDTHRLAEHLETLAADRDLARRMSTASREKSLRFTWDRVAADYLRLFGALAAPVRSPA